MLYTRRSYILLHPINPIHKQPLLP